MRTFVLISALTLTTLVVNRPTVVQAQDDGSGNLLVELIDGALFILGDQECNKIIMSQFPDSEGVEQIVVGGDGTEAWELIPWIPYEWTSYTTVNGGGFVRYDASDVVEVVLIAGGGNDQIVLQGGFDSDIFIDSGTGVDRVYSDNSVISGDLYVDTGKDGDTVVLIGVDVVGDAELSTGHGDDTVGLLHNLFLGDVTINMGVHADVLYTLRGANSIVGSLSVEMGQGNDSIESLYNPPEFAIGGFAAFDGGQGVDTFDQSGTTDLDGNPIDPARLLRLNFEIPDSE